MCGACGGATAEWLEAFLSRGYERTVVASRLSTLAAGFSVETHPAGWTLRSNGGATEFFGSPARLVAAAMGRPGAPSDAIGVERWVAGLSAHRPVEVRRDEVPPRHRETVPGPVLGGSDPRTSVNRLLGLLASRSLPRAAFARTLLRDGEGEWVFGLGITSAPS